MVSLSDSLRAMNIEGQIRKGPIDIAVGFATQFEAPVESDWVSTLPLLSKCLKGDVLEIGVARESGPNFCNTTLDTQHLAFNLELQRSFRSVASVSEIAKLHLKKNVSINQEVLDFLQSFRINKWLCGVYMKYHSYDIAKAVGSFAILLIYLRVQELLKTDGVTGIFLQVPNQRVISWKAKQFIWTNPLARDRVGNRVMIIRTRNLSLANADGLDLIYAVLVHCKDASVEGIIRKTTIVLDCRDGFQWDAFRLLARYKVPAILSLMPDYPGKLLTVNGSSIIRNMFSWAKLCLWRTMEIIDCGDVSTPSNRRMLFEHVPPEVVSPAVGLADEDCLPISYLGDVKIGAIREPIRDRIGCENSRENRPVDSSSQNPHEFSGILRRKRGSDNFGVVDVLNTANVGIEIRRRYRVIVPREVLCKSFRGWRTPAQSRRRHCTLNIGVDETGNFFAKPDIEFQEPCQTTEPCTEPRTLA